MTKAQVIALARREVGKEVREAIARLREEDPGRATRDILEEMNDPSAFDFDEGGWNFSVGLGIPKHLETTYANSYARAGKAMVRRLLRRTK